MTLTQELCRAYVLVLFSILEARLWSDGLSHMVELWALKEPPAFQCCGFLCSSCLWKFHLDVVDSHLLLSWSSSATVTWRRHLGETQCD